MAAKTPHSRTETETETIEKCALSDAEFQIRSKFSELHERLNKLEQELLTELDLILQDRVCKRCEVDENLRELKKALEKIETAFVGNILNKEYSETRKSILRKITELQQFSIPIDSIILIWDTGFERCLEKICTISHVLPSREEQRSLIQQIARSREPELGQIWFVVSAKWFKDWRNEVNFDNSIFKNFFFSCQPKRIPIDNSNIVKGSTLKYGLKKNRHFVLLHSDAWDLLLGWHGIENDSISISRKTYFDNSNNRIQVDLWECSAKENPERKRKPDQLRPVPDPSTSHRGVYFSEKHGDRGKEDSWRPPGWNCDIKVHVREPDNTSLYSAKGSLISVAFSFN